VPAELKDTAKKLAKNVQIALAGVKLTLYLVRPTKKGKPGVGKKGLVPGTGTVPAQAKAKSRMGPFTAAQGSGQASTKKGPIKEFEALANKEAQPTIKEYEKF